MRQLKITLLFVTCLALFGLRVQQPAQAQAMEPSRKFEHGKAGKDGKQGHRDLACAQCHLSTDQAPYAVIGKGTPGIKDAPVTPFPGHASCVQCHNFAVMAFLKPSYCAMCHQSNPLSPQQPSLFAAFQTTRAASDFGTAFSHVAHRRPLPNDLTLQPNVQTASAQTVRAGQAPLCFDCHSPRDASAQDFNVGTGHATCFVCHLNKPDSAKADFPARQDCAGCHQLPGATGVKQLAPHWEARGRVTDFRHNDHEFDTRPIRKGSYRADQPRDALCVECHHSVAEAASLNALRPPQAADCTSCHNEAGRPGLPEPLRAAVLESLARLGN